MSKFLLPIIAAAMLVAPLATASPDRYDRGRSSGYTVSKDQAVAIAQANGMVDVFEIERDDGLWEIEGFDSAGTRLEIEIDGWSAEIVKLEYYGRSGDESGRYHHSRGHD